MRNLLILGDIHTMHPAMPCVEAMVVEGERVAFIGSKAAASAWLAGRAWNTVDAHGAAVLPGFNDAHLHFAHYALQSRRVSLRPARSRQDVMDRLREGLGKYGEKWLIGEGWNQDNFLNRDMVTREDLDAVSTDIPIIAARVCGHIMAVNSRTLSMAGLDTADGLLREDEQKAVWQIVPQPGHKETLEAMTEAQWGLYEKGITSIQSDDLSGRDTREFLTLLRDAGDSGGLKVRYGEQANVGNPQALEAFFREGLHKIRGSRMRVSCVKLLADGSLGARTAALDRAYADAPETRGIALYSQEALNELVRIAVTYQFPVAVHAIGDAAMRQVLDAIEAEGRGLPHAIVHAQITTAEQVARCGRLGVTIMAQPIFLNADAPIVYARVGNKLAETSYRWRSMLGAGANVAFSTDCPVEPFDPFPNLYNAMTRRCLFRNEVYLPEEAFSLEEALFAYTAAGAAASGEGLEKGRLYPGMLADFLILNSKLIEEDKTTIREAEVAQTYIGGERVFAKLG